jgi:hypothetical protein
MTMIIEIIGWLAAIYLAAGLLFALAFVVRGVDMVDEGARHAGPGFRIIILPGAAVFWPLLLKKWNAALKASATKKQNP